MTTWIMLGSVTIPAVPQSVVLARRFAAGLLPAGDRTDTVVLLISEAVTNSVTHSGSRFGGEITVLLFDIGGAIRTEVIDSGGPTVPTRSSPGDLATGGRGVGLIEDLADRSGHHTDEAGYLHTWFEVS